MKSTFQTVRSLLLCSVIGIGLPSIHGSFAQTVPALVNYQGRLANPDGTALATGDYQLTFRFYDSATNNSGLVWGPQVFDGVAGQGHGGKIPVVQGYFNVMLGPVDTNGVSLTDAFTASNRFVEIRVGTNNPILPRQQILSAPFALQAANSAKLAGHDWSAVFGGTNDPVNGKISGSKLASGTLTSTQIASNQVWLMGGNANSTSTHFIGTTDNQAFEIKVNGQRAYRFEPAGNTIGGSAANTVQTNNTLTTIAGGHANSVQLNSGSATIGGGYDNIIKNDSTFSTIGGGGHNAIGTNAPNSTVGGGTFNVIQTNASNVTISGGTQNTIGTGSYESTVGGGKLNVIGTNSAGTLISGGHFNFIGNSADEAVVVGGIGNIIQSTAYRAVIGGGYSNSIQSGSGGSIIGGGNLNSVQFGVGNGTIGGGQRNLVLSNSSFATAGGGSDNTVGGSYATINGGGSNTIQVSATSATIGGGFLNQIGSAAWNAVVAGGRSNVVGSDTLYGTIGGGFANNIGTNSDYSLIGGGDQNFIADNVSDAAILGGSKNFIRSNASFTTISGGRDNTVDPDSLSASIGGGRLNRIFTNATYSAIAGGYDNAILTNADYAIVAGGNGNRAGGDYSFAAGRRAKAIHDGAFVWADSAAADFASSAANQFLIRATGGVGIGKTNPATALDVNGTVTATTFNPPSDRNLKENFSSINPQEVLAKIATMSISRWNFIGDTTTRHLGPMAQDFHAAFGLGTDERHIATVDADGVALAAIQGLNQKLEEKLKEKDVEIELLKERLNRLEKKSHKD